MKKNIFFVAIVLLCIVSHFVMTSLDSKLDISLLSVDALALGESSGGCKWKSTDCPGWGNGDYEACLTNGDGNSCSCGQVSRNCPD